MSAVDTRAVPCNLLSWPKIAPLLPDQKLVVYYLWVGPDARACGCYVFSRQRAAADLSVTVDALEDCLRDFRKRKIIDYDLETCEIFVLDWPRWIQFKSPPAKGALWAAIDRIKSKKLSTLVKKAYETIPRPGKGVEKAKGVGKGLLPSEVNDADRGRHDRFPPGWWKDIESAKIAGKAVGIEPNAGESLEQFCARIREQMPKLGRS